MRLPRAALIALAVACAWGPPVREAPAKDEPGGPEVVALALAELSDPDLLPPDLFAPIDDLTTGLLVPAPKGVVVRAGSLNLDWDGDGRNETVLRSGRSAVVRVPKGTWIAPLLVAERGARWRAGPAALLRGRADDGAVELLDADLDGRFDGPADRVRWSGGAFHRPAPERRLATPRGLVRWSLAGEGDQRRLTLTPDPLPTGTTALQTAGLVGVNDLRNRWGLAPLTLDLTWCDGCAKHAEYIRLQPTEGFGHVEREDRPGFSPEGRLAAAEGVMERTGDPASAAQSLTSMILHRTPFLCDPATPLGVGAVAAPGSSTRDPFLGGPGFSVLRAGRAMGSHDFPTVVPGPGQRDVPLKLRREVPVPDAFPTFYDRQHGYPVSVSFLPTGERAPRLVLRVVGKPGPVEGVAFTPEKPVSAAFAHNYGCVFFVAQDPLENETLYEAECTTGAGPTQRTLVWRFTTGRR